MQRKKAIKASISTAASSVCLPPESSIVLDHSRVGSCRHRKAGGRASASRLLTLLLVSLSVSAITVSSSAHPIPPLIYCQSTDTHLSSIPTDTELAAMQAMEMRRVVLSVLLLLAVLPSAAVAANYTVGDGKGWNPDVDYTAWVNKHKPFYKGDWLVFEYQNGRSDVVQVDEVGYDNCDKANALSSYSKGHTYAFRLKDAKDYYFICSYGYCYSGMKLHVTAKSSSNSDDENKPSSKATNKDKANAASPSLLAVATPFATIAAALLLHRIVMLF